MADPLTILGAAAAVVQIVDTTLRLVTTAKEVYASSEGVICEHAELSRLTEDLQKMNAQLAYIPLQIDKSNVIDHHDLAIRQLCCSCNEIGKELLDRLASLKMKEGDSGKLASMEYALKYLKNKKKLDALAARITAHKEQLDTRILVSIKHRFNSQNLDQRCRFDSLDRTGRDILDSIKESRNLISADIGHQNEYLTHLLVSHKLEIIDRLDVMARSRSPSPDPSGRSTSPTPTLVNTETIHDMVEKGDITGMQNVLRKTPDAIFTTSINGETPLHIAARKGDVKTVSYLIRKGANKNGDNELDQTPLHLAVLGRHTETVRHLIAKGADPEAGDIYQKIPLDFAEPGSEIEWILIVGSDYKDREKAGRDALRHFINVGNVQVVSALMNQGVGPNGDEFSDGVLGRPLFDAIRKEHMDVVDLLLHHGADVEARSYRGGTALNYVAELHPFGTHCINLIVKLLDFGADINATNELEFSALHEVVAHGYDDIAQLLIDRGADLDLVTFQEENLLIIALRTQKYTADAGVGMLKMLLKAGCASHINGTNFQGDTALHLACMEGLKEAVAALIEHGADVNLVSSDSGWTPLMCACRYGHSEQLQVIKLLLDQGADISRIGNDGNSAADLAKLSGTNESADDSMKLAGENVDALLEMLSESGWEMTARFT